MLISQVWFPWEGGKQGASCAGGDESQSTMDGDPGFWESGDTGLNCPLRHPHCPQSQLSLPTLSTSPSPDYQHVMDPNRRCGEQPVYKSISSLSPEGREGCTQFLQEQSVVGMGDSQAVLEQLGGQASPARTATELGVDWACPLGPTPRAGCCGSAMWNKRPGP